MIKKSRGIEVKGAHYLLEVDKPLVASVDRKVRFLMTSDDVIHSWKFWVQTFAVKKDTVPGFVTGLDKIDEPGVYRGTVYELCGRAFTASCR